MKSAKEGEFQSSNLTKNSSKEPKEKSDPNFKEEKRVNLVEAPNSFKTVSLSKDVSRPKKVSVDNRICKKSPTINHS